MISKKFQEPETGCLEIEKIELGNMVGYIYLQRVNELKILKICHFCLITIVMLSPRCNA